MNYDLAKKLKDAGWQADLDRNQAVDVDGFMWASPTLSQLIEACGESFDFVGRAPDGESWLAQMTQEAFEEYRKTSPESCVVECDGNEWGDTPEEAVAQLWLSLQAASAPNNL